MSSADAIRIELADLSAAVEKAEQSKQLLSLVPHWARPFSFKMMSKES